MIVQGELSHLVRRKRKMLIRDSLILIAVGPSGDIWIDGDQVDPRFIRSRFELRLADAPNSAVIIQADSDADNEQVMLILEAAREANILDVSISAEA